MQTALRDFEVAADDREQIVEIMCDAGRSIVDCFHLCDCRSMSSGFAPVHALLRQCGFSRRSEATAVPEVSATTATASAAVTIDAAAVSALISPRCRRPAPTASIASTWGEAARHDGDGKRPRKSTENRRRALDTKIEARPEIEK